MTAVFSAPLLLASLAAAPAPGDRAVLIERPTGTHAVLLTVAATGSVVPRPGIDPLDAAVRATYRFRTRPLAVDGEGVTGRRSVRYYDAAGSELSVGPQPTYARLRGSRRVIVASGVPRGVEVLSPAGPLRYGELELLSSPLDPLLVGGLLPTASVAVGDRWEPTDWVGPALAGVEAVSDSAIACELTGLTDAEARGRFTGKVSGAADGAAVTVTLAGTFTFDRAARAITEAELEQTVDSTPGPVSPGLDLTFTASLTRTPTDDAGPLTPAILREAAAAVRSPEEIDRAAAVELVTPWGVRAALDRGWRFVNQNARAAVVVRLENGGPVLAATLSPLEDAEGLGPPDGDAFAASVRERLAEVPGRVERTAKLDLPDPADAGRTLLLVRVLTERPDPAGGAAEPRVRDHYLVADGRKRAEVVFDYAPEGERIAGEEAFPLLDAVRWE